MDDGLVAPTRHKIDVTTYYRMAEAGLLRFDDRVELIDGEIIDMAPIGDDHAATVSVLTHALVLASGGVALVRCQSPLRIDALNEPEPDFVLLRARADNYRHEPKPGRDDVLVVIEVSDSSLAFDRQVKLPLYARAGLAEYWIVDLKRRVVAVYTDPVDDEYATIRTYRAGERVALSQAPELVIPLAGVFG